MEYDSSAEYPVILKRDPDYGVIGTWYQNQIKPLEQIIEELTAAGMTADVEKIKTYMDDKADFSKRMEGTLKTHRLIKRTQGITGLQLVEVIGQVEFEPLSNCNWTVSGNMTIEFEICNDADPDLDMRYAVQLNCTKLVDLSKWDGQAWVVTEEITIPHDHPMRQLFEGHGCTTTPLMSKPIS